VFENGHFFYGTGSNNVMKNFFLLVLWMFLFSCSKENKIEQKLNGNWQITKVTIKDGEGFFYESFLPQGYVSFNIANKTISSQINFKYTNIALSVFEDSLFLDSYNYDLDTKLERFYVNGITSIYDFKILSLTKSDLQIEFYDSKKNQMKGFILVKKEN
jgi:hypothetical protein